MRARAGGPATGAHLLGTRPVPVLPQHPSRIPMVRFARRLTSAAGFERFIVLVIIAAAVVVGLETQPAMVGTAGALLGTLNLAILAVFILEAALRMIAAWPRPLSYFTSGWNVFDFGIIVLSLVPGTGEFATVARLVRILRVLRLVTAMPKLRLMVATLVRCIPGMGHVLSLMAILFYVYGVAGYHLYGAHDPAHWGSLGRALLTLFQIATLEAWTDIMNVAMELGSLHWIYFVSFVLLGTFVVVNLFVAVVINSLEESHREVAQSEAAEAAENLTEGSDDIHAIRALLGRLERRLDALETSRRNRGETD